MKSVVVEISCVNQGSEIQWIGIKPRKTGMCMRSDVKNQGGWLWIGNGRRKL
jgi:hypothetical protein